MSYISEEDAIYYIRRTLHEMVDCLNVHNIPFHSKYLEMLDLQVPRDAMGEFDFYLAMCNMNQTVPTLDELREKFNKITGSKVNEFVMKEILRGYVREDRLPIFQKFDLEDE